MMTGHEVDKTRGVAGDRAREPVSGLAEVVSALLGRRVRDLGVEFDGRGLRGWAGEVLTRSAARPARGDGRARPAPVGERDHRRVPPGVKRPAWV